jgi:N6-adenosine-specific RNA methylase IME4
MTVDEIAAMRVADFAMPGAHLWLWTTNQFLEAGFHVMRAWGFRYLAPITWVKPSGLGAWFVHRTQTILFGYMPPLEMRERYKPTVINANARAHSAKPDCTYDFIESVSEAPRLELFAREQRLGWSTWGNEVPCHVDLVA